MKGRADFVVLVVAVVVGLADAKTVVGGAGVEDVAGGFDPVAGGFDPVAGGVESVLGGAAVVVVVVVVGVVTTLHVCGLYCWQVEPPAASATLVATITPATAASAATTLMSPRRLTRPSRL
ncbi:MAG TPA: hypothetical protein VG325_12755 [Solirubrobacteraceae bacterium]|nr:hypothetical protein [Solirubrobacteraceae bacterium]